MAQQDMMQQILGTCMSGNDHLKFGFTTMASNITISRGSRPYEERTLSILAYPLRHESRRYQGP